MDGSSAYQLGDRNPPPPPWLEHWQGVWAGGAKWNVYCGDACRVLDALSADRYACVITSPPYFWQRDYEVAGQIGLEPTVNGYVEAITSAMDAVRRVLSPRGVLFLNLGDTYYSGKGRPQGKDRKHSGRRMSVLRAVDGGGLGVPKKTLLGMPWRVALAMIDKGWVLRSDIIWRRTNPVPEPKAVDRPWRSHEHVFLFSKGRVYDFDRSALREASVEDVWTVESQSRAGREHPAVFPAGLVRRCLAIGNPRRGPVLDPFAGSGTVLKVAAASGMSTDGIDLNWPFCRQAASELAAGA